MARLHSTVLFLCAILSISQYAKAENLCPTFWTAWRDHCYRYFGDEVSWTAAVDTCRLFGAPGSPGFADLVSIHSKEEHDFLYSYWRSVRQYDNRDYKPGMWIGLTDVEEVDVYEWSDGTDVNYTNFDKGQLGHADQYRWLLYDWYNSDTGANPQGRWHDIGDRPDWYFQFMCKMAYE